MHPAAHTADAAPAPAKQRTRAPQRTPPARAVPHTPVAPDSAGGDAAEQEQEQDGISCGNSSDDFEPPSCSRRLAAARAAVAGGSAGKKRRSSGSRRPAPTGAAGTAGTPASTGPAGPSAAAGRLLDSLLGPSPLQQGPARGSMQQQAQWQQQQQQQQKQADPHPGHGDGSGQAWIPPKYKQVLQATQQAGFGGPSNTQQQQQHWQQPADSSRRPPGLLERQQPAAAAAGGWHDPCMGMHGAPGPCAGTVTAAGAGGDACQAWWWVLPDFVPVEVLLQQQCNPR